MDNIQKNGNLFIPVGDFMEEMMVKMEYIEMIKNIAFHQKIERQRKFNYLIFPKLPQHQFHEPHKPLLKTLVEKQGKTNNAYPFLVKYQLYQVQPLEFHNILLKI